MEISKVSKAVEARLLPGLQESIVKPGEIPAKAGTGKGLGMIPPEEQEQEKQTLQPKELQTMVSEMNQFMVAINTDLQFAWHEKAGQLMVQIIDQSSAKVLKEFPSHEFLDTIARIRDFVGALLDVKV
ncbi:MAG: flagellar protein FlaG [Heliobacteriaceae bacterium]|nr:flagellar protein FlaG [Heliobacteriaceae bacterium]MDD4588501.1 flagellar protein FlaG [Heliobacteriaceae bacterium]